MKSPSELQSEIDQLKIAQNECDVRRRAAEHAGDTELVDLLARRHIQLRDKEYEIANAQGDAQAAKQQMELASAASTPMADAQTRNPARQSELKTIEIGVARQCLRFIDEFQEFIDEATIEDIDELDECHKGFRDDIAKLDLMIEFEADTDEERKELLARIKILRHLSGMACKRRLTLNHEKIDRRMEVRNKQREVAPTEPIHSEIRSKVKISSKIKGAAIGTAKAVGFVGACAAIGLCMGLQYDPNKRRKIVK